MSKRFKITSERASQEFIYRLYKKFLKSKKDKEVLNEFKEIVKRYYPNYTEDNIKELYSKLSSSGCTYATMANVIMEQFNSDVNSFKEYFGDRFCNSDGSINYNKLMLDIFVCIANMVELRVYRYESCNFNSYTEAAKVILGIDTIDTINALNALNKAGWLGDGVTADGKLIFTNQRNSTTSIFRGIPRSIARELFNIDDDNMDINKLESLLKENRLGFKFSNINVASKFSGLESVSSINIKTWMQVYFERNGINLDLEAHNINKTGLSFNEFRLLVDSNINNGYSINVSPSVDSNIAMTDGSILGWTNINNHAMNFESFDSNGNIIVCSWGERHIIPKEYYNQLDFIAIKLINNTRKVNRSI